MLEYLDTRIQELKTKKSNVKKLYDDSKLETSPKWETSMHFNHLLRISFAIEELEKVNKK